MTTEILKRATGTSIISILVLAVMHLSISCPTPRGGGGGGGDTGDLTNRQCCQIPHYTGAKSAVKSPLCPYPHSRGFDNNSRMTKRILNACD